MTRLPVPPKKKNPRCDRCNKEAKHIVHGRRLCRCHYNERVPKPSKSASPSSESASVVGKKTTTRKSKCPSCHKRGIFCMIGDESKQLYCKEHVPNKKMAEDTHHQACEMCGNQATYMHNMHGEDRPLCTKHKKELVPPTPPVYVTVNIGCGQQIVPCTSMFSYDKVSGQFFNNADRKVLAEQHVPGVERRGRPRSTMFQGYTSNFNVNLKLALPPSAKEQE